MRKLSHSVFISYAAKDLVYARKLVEALREQGIEALFWYDSITVGTEWQKEIRHALKRAEVFVILISPEFLSSQWMMFELGAAVGQAWESPDLRVIPVIVRSVPLEALPTPLRRFQILDASALSPKRLSEELKQAIEYGEKMFPEEKLNAVRSYLLSEFPNYSIDDRYDFDRIAQIFRVYNDKIHLLTVSREFIDDHSASEISNILRQRNLGKYFQQKKGARIIVTNSGIRSEEK